MIVLTVYPKEKKKSNFFQVILDSLAKKMYNIQELSARMGGNQMAEIKIKDNESLDNALRRFKRSCARAGVMSDARRHEHYEKPSVRRKKKSEAARKRKFK